eukprot:scaffold701_cov158-Amphora_coffeaeformis.AAC.16
MECLLGQQEDPRQQLTSPANIRQPFISGHHRFGSGPSIVLLVGYGTVQTSSGVSWSIRLSNKPPNN